MFLLCVGEATPDTDEEWTLIVTIRDDRCVKCGNWRCTCDPKGLAT